MHINLVIHWGYCKVNKRKSFISIACLMATLFLPGCAQYQWQKYGASQNDFNRDSYECQTEAARTYPTQVVAQHISTGYTTPSYTSCYGSGTAYGNSGYGYGNNNVNCTTTGGQYVPGVVAPVDVNSKNRAQHAQQCMYARGWQLIRVDQNSRSTNYRAGTDDYRSAPMECQVSTDCRQGQDCRSRKGGGTECR